MIGFLSQIYAPLSVNFSGLKMCECKKNDKYQVCLPSHHKASSVLHSFQMILFYLDSFGSFIIFRPATADYLQETSSLPSTGTGIEHLFTTRQFPSWNSKENLETLGIEFLRKVIILGTLWTLPDQTSRYNVSTRINSKNLNNYSTFALLVHSNKISFKITDNQMQ